MVRRLFATLLLLVVSAPAWTQEAFTRLRPNAEELESSLRTDWYGVYFQGKKIGYFRAAREKTDEGIREAFELKMKLLSFGQKAEMTIAQSLTFEPKAPYALTKATYHESAGKTATDFVLKRTGPDAFEVTQTVGPNVRKRVAPNIDYTLEDAMAAELWLRRGPAKGSTLLARDLEVKEQKIDSQKSTLLSQKSALIGGVEVKFYEVDSVSGHDQISVLSRHDDQGKLLSGKIANIFELRAEPENEAKNSEYSKDLFVLGMAKIEKGLGDLRRVEELTLEVQNGAKAFTDGPRQSVIQSDGKTLLRLGKRYGKSVSASPEEVAENLKETSAYDLGDPRVKALAKKAVGDAATDADKVRNITRFVHDFVRPRYGNTLPTIHHLLERREGDCKSYALLFTTLARANGLPAREVAGLLYAGDETKAFGGHAWNEVVLDGVWTPIDASLNETEVNATHLSFGTDKTAAKNLLETIGNLRLRVVEMKTR